MDLPSTMEELQSIASCLIFLWSALVTLELLVSFNPASLDAVDFQRVVYACSLALTIAILAEMTFLGQSRVSKQSRAWLALIENQKP